MSIEKGGSKGGSKPTPNPEDEGSLKKSGLVYKKDKNGKAQSGGQLRQSPAGQVERYRHMIKIIEQEIKKIQENKAQSGGQLRQSPAEQVEQYRQMIKIIEQEIKEVEGKNKA